MFEVLLFLFAGVISAFLGGLFGIGGGIVLVPFLTFFSPLSMVEASGISLFCIIASSLSVSSKKMKDGLVNLNLATQVETTALLFGFFGSLLAYRLPESTIKICFAMMVTILALLMVTKTSEVSSPETVGGKGEGGVLFQGVIAISGLFAGLLGIGGGALIVPILTKVARIPMKVATATSTYIMGMITAGGLIGHLFSGEFPVVASLLALGGVKVGAILGSKSAKLISDKLLNGFFFVLLAWISVKMWMEVVG